MGKVWNEIKKWGKGAIDAALDFFTFGAASQLAQEVREDDYDKLRSQATDILSQLDTDQININQLKDSLMNRKSDLFNSILSSSPFGKQYEDMKRQVKDINKDLKDADSISKTISKNQQNVSKTLDRVNKMETESGLINQLANNVPIATYDSSYSEKLSDMSSRINK